MELHQNIFRLKYNFEIQPKNKKEFVLGLSGASETKYDLLESKLMSYKDEKRNAFKDVEWQENLFSSNERDLNSMYSFALNAATSSYKEIGDNFKGFFAGIHYQSPARTYFRDGYWTVLPLLPYKPEWVRNEILTLAYGVGEDGSCPSAVIYNSIKEKYELWWPDHYDSPSFFVMMLYDYLSWTHDDTILKEKINSKSILEHAKQALSYLINLVPTDKGLFLKPENFNDWADNVIREGIVLYDNVLFIKALQSMSEIMIYLGDTKESEYYKVKYDSALSELHEIINEDDQLFNYITTDGFKEGNNSIEWALLVLFDLVDEKMSDQIINTLEESLETRNNNKQSYGDWGVMVSFPFYSNVHHIEQKSMAPYRYHNGADWPYLDGVYAMSKLQRNNEEWHYPLTRWFTYSLEQKWFTPVEYYGPVYGKGSNLQGWSAMPAAAMLMGGTGLYPKLNENKVTLKMPQWGDSTFKDISFRGNIYNLYFENENVVIKNENNEELNNHPFNFNIL